MNSTTQESHDTHQAAAALRMRAVGSLLFTASHPSAPEHLTAFHFWRGYLKALADVTGDAARAVLLADARRSGYEPPSYLQRAFAALPERIEALTLAQVQQFLATQGVEVSADAVAHLKVDAAEQLEDDKGVIVHPHDEHAAAVVDGDDGAQHGNAPCVDGAATVAQEGSAS